MFFVNPPICVLVLLARWVLLADDPGARNQAGTFDTQGAVLITGGTLLLVYSLVRAPIVGWGSAQTVGDTGRISRPGRRVRLERAA